MHNLTAKQTKTPPKIRRLRVKLGEISSPRDKSFVRQASRTLWIDTYLIHITSNQWIWKLLRGNLWENSDDKSELREGTIQFELNGISLRHRGNLISWEASGRKCVKQ